MPWDIWSCFIFWFVRKNRFLNRNCFVVGQYNSLLANHFFLLLRVAESNLSTSVRVRVYKFLQNSNPLHTAVLLNVPDVTNILRHNPPSNILRKGKLFIRLAGKVQQIFQVSWVLLFLADTLDAVSKPYWGVP